MSMRRIAPNETLAYHEHLHNITKKRSVEPLLVRHPFAVRVWFKLTLCTAIATRVYDRTRNALWEVNR